MGSGEAVGVVVVTHDSRATILPCLAALREQVRQVVVVDTASGDGTAELVEDAGIPVLRGPNRGFGAACNAGAAALGTEFLLFQNPDAVIAPGRCPGVGGGPSCAGRRRPPGGARPPVRG
jgi:GT2 family glycosyltransferase